MSMRNLFLSATLMLSFFLFGTVQSVEAQREVRLSATPKAFQTFYARFRAAALKQDKAAVLRLTNFPFEYGWDAGDEGTYSKAQFNEKFDEIFDSTSNLLSQKNPMFYVDSGSYSLTNEENAGHYLFKKVGAGYKFSAIIIEP